VRSLFPPDRRTQFRAVFNALRSVPVLLWRTDRRLTCCLFLAQAFQALIPLAQLWVVKLIIDRIVAAVRLPASQADTSPILWLVAVEVGLAVAGLLAREAVQVLRTVLAERLTAYVSTSILSHAQNLDLDVLEQPEYHDRLRRAEESAFYRPANLLVQTLAIVQGAITLAGVGLVLATVQPLALPLILLAAIPYAVVQSGAATSFYTLSVGQTHATRLARYFSHLLSADAAAKEVRVFGLSDYLLGRYRGILSDHQRQIGGLALRRGLKSGVASLLPAIVFGILFAYLALQAASHHISIGDLTLYIGLILQSQAALQQLMFSMSGMVESSLFLDDYRSFLALASSIHAQDARQPVPARIVDGVSFEDITYAYPGKKTPALQAVSLQLRAGETVAIVGENGAGKTTLVKLLARLYDPDSGRIAVDGIDVREFDPVEWRSRIAVIFQDFLQFYLSAAENVGLGNVGFLEDDARIVAASRRSGAHEVIERLPLSYRTVLGRWFDQGVQLSGGEWQRIALARAFMRDSPILILDEPTASLDARAEFETFQRLRGLSQGRTVLIISHRFSTVRMADRIYVLDAGHLIETGSHNELMQQEGRYAELFHLQAAGYR
jgi:ATP-binding cassette, subfamily B, bacterial